MWQVLRRLAEGGVRCIAMRCAGFDLVDVAAAKKLGIKVVRVPTYSPASIAEHSVALSLALNRRVSMMWARAITGARTELSVERCNHGLSNKDMSTLSLGAPKSQPPLYRAHHINMAVT